jgi:rhodanese-related sulfurtransferase
MSSVANALSAMSIVELKDALQGGQPPLVIDVRKRPAFEAAPDMIAGALRRDPVDVDRWIATLPAAHAVVVYCIHGREVSQSVAKRLGERGIRAGYLAGGIEAWKDVGGARDRKPLGASTRWVTRERPKIDRIACPWLVARFIDPGAQFLYVPAPQVLEAAGANDAIPYDIPDVHFSHVGERCSFDAFLAHYRLRDPALEELAVIVRAADTACLDLAPQASGLAAISLGLSRNFADDHEMLEHGMVMYDALYTWCRQGKEEVHTWNPQAYR